MGLARGGIAKVGAVIICLSICGGARAQDDPPAPKPKPQPAPAAAEPAKRPASPPAPRPYPYPYPYPYPPHYYPPPYYQPQPQPPPPEVVGHRVETEIRTGLVAGGAAMFAVGYLAPLSISAATEFSNESHWMAVPLAGPVLTMVARDWLEWCSRDLECTGNGFANTFAGIGMVLVTLLQAGGLAMFIAGLAARKTVVKPIYAVNPLLTDDGAGVGFSMRF